MHEHGGVEKHLKLAIILTSVYFVVEVVGGYISGSLSLLGDAGHMFRDVFALFISLSAINISKKLPTKTKTFGYHRIETVAALANGVILIAVSLLILSEAYQRIYFPHPIQSGTMFIVSIIGLLVNAYIASKLVGFNDINVKSALFHVMTDALFSVAVVVASIWIYFTGQYFVDPALGVIIGTVIVVSAISIINDTIHILLEFTPKDVVFDDVIKDMESVEGVTGTHNIHIWSLCSHVNAIDAHILTNKMGMNEIEIMKKTLKNKLEKYHIKHATLEFECEKCEDAEQVKNYHH